MANKYLLARDVISGQEATAQAIIDGQVVDLFMAKSIEATFTKRKSEIRTLGKRGTQSKTVGWSGTGTLNVYYTSSVFRKMALDYIKKGVDLYFTLIVVNRDPTSTIGTQTMALYNCNLDATTLAKFDTEADALDESMTFTFDDAEMLSEFVDPQ